MKQRTAMGIVLLLVVTTLMPPLVINGESISLDGVNINWQGRQLIVTNNNNYPIYNVSLDDCTLTGFMLFGWVVAYDHMVSELLADASCSFSIGTDMLFGIGFATLTATVSYIDQGEQVTQDSTINLFLLGSITFFIG